ncbi:MAG: hypothetical protein P0Y60_14405 [Candidatus Microbacterium colombiense]|nr:MAG: hypothetical protein P0Y60_14405 [Microbacterium sp.]
MGATDWRQYVDEDTLPDGMAEFFDELHSSGWYVRSRWGDASVRIWPDDGRRYQVTIDLRHPINEPRREVILARIEEHQQAVEARGGR